MESENLKDIVKSFCQIDIGDEPGSKKNDIYTHSAVRYSFKPKPILRYIPKQHVDFEQYIKENCQNKIQILNREKFEQINRPLVIFFNHFRVKCAYHTEWLDRFYQLSLKYGDHIEFIAADMIDMDVMYPGRNPINFFCRLVRPEHESPSTYFIDEKKRIYEYFDAYKTLESLSEVCENLLNGKLFPSQPLPEDNENRLLKICVHNNYEELILKSTKHVFLIINLDRHQHSEYEPNYENVALALKDYNLNIVYMEAEKNYVPFKYHANGYPTILFIPCNDKDNFIYYGGLRQENLIIEFLQNAMEQPEFLQLKQQQLKSSLLQINVNVSDDFQLEFHELPEFFKQNFDNKFKVLDRGILEKVNRYYIIVFMDFSEMKCLAHHVHWLNKIYQLVESSYSYQFFVADFKDIDIINTKWKPSEIKNVAQGKPRIYAMDCRKHTYEYGDFDSASNLYYFAESLRSNQLYYSQLYRRENLNEKVKEWTAEYFNAFVKNCKKHIFITFYSSDDVTTEIISNLLDQLADDVKDLNVEIVKFDVKLNYVGLEYSHDSYPVHYFIPNSNKRYNELYIDSDLNKDKMVEFIKKHLQLN